MTRANLFPYLRVQRFMSLATIFNDINQCSNTHEYVFNFGLLINEQLENKIITLHQAEISIIKLISQKN